MNAISDPVLVTPDLNDPAAKKPKKVWTLKPIRDAWENLTSRKIKSPPADAVAEFLADMKRVAEHLYPEWESTLRAHIDDTELDFLDKRALFEKHDLFMYFYCGVVAIEGIKVRVLFDFDVAAELESEINDQIDPFLGRTGRTSADLVFDMFRTVKRAEFEDMVKPHDQIMKWIVRLIELDLIPETKHLLKDFLFSQEMAAPFALAQVHWWLTYKETHRVLRPKAA